MTHKEINAVFSEKHICILFGENSNYSNVKCDGTYPNHCTLNC